MSAQTASRVWNVIVTGRFFDYLLCTVYAATDCQAMEYAAEEVAEMDYEPGKKWRIELAD